MKKIVSWTMSGLIGLVWNIPVMADREIRVERLADLVFSKTLQFPASVINLQMATISAETSGRITHFENMVGDEVKKGQVLIKIDCKIASINQTRIKAGIKQLVAKRQLTRQQLERAKRLSNTSSISREELDQRKTQLDADNASIEELEASLESAQQNVENCQIKAPFTGMIIEKISSIGSYAQPGSPQLKLLKQDSVEVQLEIPIENIPLLTQASSIFFETGSKHYPLNIRKILPLVDPVSLQQIIRLEFSQTSTPPGGSYGLVNFDTKRHFIPARYIQKRKGKLGVFTVINNTALFVPLQYAEEGQSVATQLPADTLIISNQLQLINDQEVITIQP